MTDYHNMGKRTRRAWLQTYARLGGGEAGEARMAELAGHPALRDKSARTPFSAAASRARAAGLAPTEDHEHTLLWDLAMARWWAPGFVHHRQERASRLERMRGGRRGVVAGIPDFELLIPHPHSHGPPVRARLELKRTTLKPKRDPGPDWWLSWRPQSATETRYGLRGCQAWALQISASAGFSTAVAYGADEAIAWLDEVAGPEWGVAEVTPAWEMWGR